MGSDSNINLWNQEIQLMATKSAGTPVDEFSVIIKCLSCQGRFNYDSHSSLACLMECIPFFPERSLVGKCTDRILKEKRTPKKPKHSIV